MARNVLIQIRRGLEKDIGTLAVGELGFCEDTKKLYIGTVTGNVLLVAAQTVGDMLKSIYDTNNDGKVDVAEVADSVPWTGVTGKPSTFAPSVHEHLINDMQYRSIDFFVDGDANTYYPVVVSNISDYTGTGLPSRKYFELFRGYSWTAPDSWNTPTHKGGLQIYMDTYAYGWGGQQYYMEFAIAQSYSKIVADIRIPEPDTNLIIFWLRGGHARYRLLAYDKDIEVTPYIGDFVNKPGTQYERTFSPRTTIEEAYNFIGRFRKFSSIPDQYIGGSFRDPKNGVKIASLSDLPTKLSQLTKDINFDERYYTETEIDAKLAGKMSVGPITWNDLKGV